jgi:hypothetical protein
MTRFPGLAVLAAALAAALGWSARAGDGLPGAAGNGPEQASRRQAQIMKMRLTVNGKPMTATLADSPTTRDFRSLLPLSLTMNDLFGREKFGRLPRALAEGGERRRTYDIGDVIYWSPGPDVAVYYRHDGQPIPAPGIIVIGRIDGAVDALDVPGPVKVTMEAD